MFVLSKISDLIRIDPQNFAAPLAEALEDEINKKYANRVIHNLGLCICLYDIEYFEDGMTRNGDGGVFIKCKFRLIVFRPFIGEILVGWVSSCTEEGLNIKMEFFDDIHIPKELLFDTCVFVPREQAWIWKNGEHEFYIDTNEKLRFRVEQEIFTQQQPQKPSNNSMGQDTSPANQTPRTRSSVPVKLMVWVSLLGGIKMAELYTQLNFWIEKRSSFTDLMHNCLHL